MPTLSDNKTEFIINSDSIFINNRNDNHNDHIVIRTKGNLDDNDIQFENCNVKLNQGHLSCQEFIDANGNTLISFGENSINFHNKTIQNLNISTGGLSASSVASANGYASLDAELDAHLLLINGKISQTGHTASKVFVSSGGGAFVTSADCVSGDLAKIATGGAVDTNTAKISFPGFGTSASTALVGNTTTITDGQASAITANTAKSSFPGFGTTSSTALAGNTTTISSSQASQIILNTSNILSNDDDINDIKSKTDLITVTSSVSLDILNTDLTGAKADIVTNTSNIIGNDTDITNIKAKTDFISVTQAVNLDTIESSVSTNTSNISSNDTDITGVKAKTDFISVTQAVNLDTMETGISNNASAISSNLTDIQNIHAKTNEITITQAVNLDTLESQHLTNTSNITSIKAKTDYILVSQAVNLDTMESGISTNSTNISLNDTDITGIKAKTNFLSITQAVNLDTMESDITSNTDSIVTANSEISAIETKTDRITYQNDVVLNVETHGNLTLSAGAVGATSYVSNKNGNLTLKGGYDGSNDSGKISLFTNNSERMTILDSGFVGIGETTPTVPLHVKSNNNEPIAIFEGAADTLVLVKSNSSNQYDEVGYMIKGKSSVEQYWFIGTDDDTSELCFATSDDFGISSLELRMALTETGNLGIGTRTPKAGLHVKKSYYNDAWVGTQPRRYFVNATESVNAAGSDYGARHWGFYCEQDALFDYHLFIASDKRIKKNIIEINDDLALQKVRDISCCWYNYIDKVSRGDGKVLGFIAQQVKEHLPEAVSESEHFIPNEMKKIHTTWNETKMSSNDLQDVSGIKYRFYVSNDISGNEKMVELVGDEDNCFTFKEKWENVFCYGKEVDDFHTLDKQKLFALNFSATQELDKLVKKQQETINNLIQRIENLENN